VSQPPIQPHRLRDRVLGRRHVSDHLAVLVDDPVGRIRQRGLRALREQGHELRDGTRQEEVVGVQVADQLATSQFKAPVQRLGLAHVLVTFPPHPFRVCVRVALQHLWCLVGRAVVQGEAFQVRVVLAEDAVERRLEQAAGAVVRGNDDRDQGLALGPVCGPAPA
jgi:hypothetical protein